MEVSQAIWLTLLLVTALLISPKRFDEIILDFYQDAGIWIVIASCVAEYLLLLTYIGVAAYDFFKNRKMMKKMNVQRRTYEFLKFDESHRDVGNRWREPGARPMAFTGNKTRTSGGRRFLFSLKEQSRLRFMTPLASPLMIAKESRIAPNNPQLLKFDGKSTHALGRNPARIVDYLGKARRMNKSLKRKQIE